MGDELENLALHSEALVASTVPGSAAEAPADPNWKAAMQREYDSLMTNEVWSLVSRPMERQPITVKWHFAVKVNEDGKVTKYKARFVARGFTQTPGLDYHETYSPTVRLSTLRTVFACGVRQGIKFRQMDMKSAYLIAPIDEEIFLEQPEGFKQGDSDMVWKLSQAEEIAVRAQTVRAQLVRVPSTSTGAAGVSFFAARQVSLDTKEGQPPLLGTGVG